MLSHCVGKSILSNRAATIALVESELVVNELEYGMNEESDKSLTLELRVNL